MNNRLACHYSVVRFCPYPETDEFVNVGIVLVCPALGFLDGLRADLRRRGRVGRFFPELDPNVYKAAVVAWEDLLRTCRRLPADGQMLAEFDRDRLREAFFALVRPRESILYYSEPRVILSSDPAATLREVFGAYVERRFAHAVEYQERIMCQRLEQVLGEARMLQRYRLNEPVGDERYHVRFPFVRPADGDPRPRQAIKALHLDRDDPTDILRHADAWRSSVARLRHYDTAPQELLFVLQAPLDRAEMHQQAFLQVCTDLDRDGIPRVAVESTPAILDFARHVA